MFDCRSVKTADPAVAEILQLINKNCAQQDLSLNLLSRKVNLSNRHLWRRREQLHLDLQPSLFLQRY
jgi:transcriptional regulator GlxA family with amidase domain